MNVHENHLSLITDIKMYSKQYIFNRCDKVSMKMSNHMGHQSKCIEQLSMLILVVCIMLLLTNCEGHTGNIWTVVLKYGPNGVRSVRKAKVQIFSRTDQTNWSIRALLYSHNQHLGFIPDKMILN